MKTVFRISSRLRAAAPIPRDFLPIPGLDHLGLCYQQKVIADAAEFNAMQAAISDPRFPSRGAKIEAYALTPEDEAKLTAKPVPPPVEQAPEPVKPIAPAEESADAPAPRFRREGDEIFMGDERVAAIYETGLRCSKGYADLRDEIEAWLQPQPE
jgi:hypothetical protein